MTMQDLVEVKNNKVFTTSNKIAEEFGIAHKEIIRKTKNLAGEISTLDFSKMYSESVYMNAKGRDYKNYHISRDGYMFLVMNIATKKAHAKKLAFIKAFNLMESALLNSQTNKSDIEWTSTRLIGKTARREETDAIKEFTEYATAHGSTKARMYYIHITNATYKALGLMAMKHPKLRDQMSIYEVSELMLAERLAANKLREYVALKREYHDIYDSVKKDLIAFADSLKATRIE